MSWHGDPTNPVKNPIQEPIERSEKLIDVNRAEQTRRDTDTQKNFTITLEDVDNAILGQLGDLQLQVVDAGKVVKVPVFYGSPERWVSAQRDGYMRDKQGKVILPAIVFKRTTTAEDSTLQFFSQELVVSAIKKYSDKNKYTQFNILNGQNAPVSEVYDTVVPSYVLLTYHFIIWTGYVVQMNKLTEALRFATTNANYWGKSNGFRFRSRIESFGHTVEIEASQERVIKTEFDMQVHAYILPDVTTDLEKHRLTTAKRLTPKKIILGTEIVRTGFELQQMNSNSEKWRNPNYANLSYNTSVPTPGLSLDTTIQDHSFLPGGAWAGIKVDNSPLFLRIVPVPTKQDQTAQDGDMSYDSQYFYFRTNHKWTVASLSNFTNSCTSNVPLTGTEGSVEYNAQFFYIYSQGQWRRVPLTTIDLGYGNEGDIMYDGSNLYIYTQGTWTQMALTDFTVM